MEHLDFNVVIVFLLMLLVTLFVWVLHLRSRVNHYKNYASEAFDMQRRFNKANLEYIEEIKNLETSNLLLVKEVRDKTDRIKNLLECIVFLTDKAEIKEEVIKASSPDIAAELSKVLKKK